MKKISLITISLLFSLSGFTQDEMEVYRTPEEEFYSGEQVNGELSELPPEETYFEEMERQEEWADEEYPIEELEWDNNDYLEDETYFEEY